MTLLLGCGFLSHGLQPRFGPRPRREACASTRVEAAIPELAPRARLSICSSASSGPLAWNVYIKEE